MESEDIPLLRALNVERAGHLGIVAFEGWNDAGEAATRTAALLREATGATQIAEIDDERYYDYQFTRPLVARTAEGPWIDWPRTRIHRGTLPDSEVQVTIVTGVEPSFHWRGFSQVLDEYLGTADAVLLLGALLADVPHSRPLPASASTEHAGLREALDLERSSYEGPTGIIGTLGHHLHEAEVPALSAWVAVPNYVAQSPSPKAELALLGRIETLLGRALPLGDLPEDARAWETGVDELAQHDDEIADYVARLEQMRDAAELPEASGDAIAEEFERFLRRGGPGKGGQASG